MKTARRLLALVLWSLAATAVVASTLPQHQNGFSADTAYQLGDLDHINLFNGNLVVTLPLGQRYPIGPDFDFGLTLVYNSNAWLYDDRATCQTEPGIPINANIVVPQPHPRANAGFGWSVSLGRLYPPNQGPFNSDPSRWLYESPDGGPHFFGTQLHPGAPSTPQAGTWYTQDGTYLRMRSTGCQSSGGTGCRLIEFSDGHRHEFRNFGGTVADWRITRMRDGHDNAVDIDYTTENGDPVWSITDPHTRTYKVVFDVVGKVVEVQVPTFGGDTGTYAFTYGTRTLRRSGYEPGACLNTADLPGTTVAVAALSQLMRPDGLGYAMAYYSEENTAPEGAVVQAYFPGGLDTLDLPTGGRLGWDYVVFESPGPGPEPEPGDKPDIANPASKAYAVKTRRTYTSSTSLDGTWTYDVSFEPSFASVDDSCRQITTVTNPLGYKTDHHFSVALDSARRWAFGLPMALCNAGGGAASAPYLSQVHRDASTSGSAVREIRVEYQADGKAGTTASPNPWNARLVHRREVFLDDGNRYRDVTSSDFDGFGQTGRVVVSGNFGPTKTVETEFAHGKTLAGFTIPATTARWLWTPRTSQETSQDGATFRVETCHDDDTGALERRRVLADTNPSGGLTVSASDVVTAWAIGTHGFPDDERTWGGDGGGAPVGNLCTANLASTPAYVTTLTHTAGAPSKVEAIDNNSEVALRRLDRTIDPSIGQPSSEKDMAGIVTTYGYDALGRRTLVHPTGDAWSRTAYYGAAIELEQCSTNMTSGDGKSCPNDHRRLTRTFYGYDGLGRLERQQNNFPGDVQQRDIEHNALGWRTQSGTWANDDKATVYNDFDRYGRAGRVSHPANGGGFDTTLFTYQGERLVTREVQMATGGPPSYAQQSTWITEERDLHGRLVMVCEAQAAAWSGSCTGQKTINSYDAADRLIRVCQNVSGSGSCGQTRRFTYDGRGFLIAEQHPEIGLNGNGWIDFSYDAIGNVTSKDIRGTTLDPPLTYTYDCAGRLIRIEEHDAATGLRPLKAFRYARNNSGTDKRAGKLVSATRWNWGQAIAPLSRDAGDVPAIVTDRYEYRGSAGRVSKKTTSVAIGPTHHAWTSQWSYDLLGNVASITYPQAKRWPLTSDEPPRTVTRGYTLGYLSSITGYVDSMRYDLGGELLTGITYHGDVNGTNVQWTQSFDPATRLPRPFDIGAIGLAGPTSSVMLGGHLYDGVGNVRQIGILDFDYDHFGRLQSESDDGGTSLRQRAFYDPYGNLTTLVTDGASEDFQPSASTNRIGRTGTTYDERGNLTQITLGGGQVDYTWDGLDQLLYQRTSTHTWTYLYDASDDRVLRWTCALDGCGDDRDATERWTQRGLGGEVLRVAEGATSDTLDWSEDFVYGNGRALARVAPDGTDFLLHDHLGSTRLIVDAATHQLETFQSFYPFGEQVSGPGPEDVALKFTGHERDEEGPASRALDYMRARYCSPELGRFLTVDPARSAEPSMPQSWNRLSYVLNNPIKYVDPDGEEPRIAIDVREPNYARNRKFREDFRAGLHERLPVIGGPIASVVDSFILSEFFPSSLPELADNANATIVGMAVPWSGPTTRAVSKAVGLPAWRRVAIDIEHIASGHLPEGARVSPAKTLFPEMSLQELEQMVREAYRGAKRIKTQGDRVLVRGEAGGMTIEMWLNLETRVIETAFPIY